MAKAQSRLRAPYDVLCKLLGNPEHHPKSGERVAWDVELDGARVRITGHTEDKTANGTILEALDATWRVHASDTASIERACKHLSQRVIGAVAGQSGGRSLSAEGKAALNALLKQGVSMNDAMKRVRDMAQVNDERAKQEYAWPIASAVPAAPTRAARGGDDEDGEEDDDEEESGMDGFSVIEPDVPPPEPPKKLTRADLEEKEREEEEYMDADAYRAHMRQKRRGLSDLMRNLMRANGDLLEDVAPPAQKKRDDATVPRASLSASYASLARVLGDPEHDESDGGRTRWRFVIDPKRPEGKQLVRHDDEPSDDATDIDGAVTSDAKDARTADMTKWAVTSSSPENLAKVRAWLDARLR